MNKIYKCLMVTFVTAIFSASSALADLIDGPGGLSIGFITNYAEFQTSGSETENDSKGVPEVNTTPEKIKETASFPGMFIEFSGGGHKGDEGGLGFTIGFEYTPGSAEIGTETRTDTSDAWDKNTNDDDGTYTGKAEIENLKLFYIEPTYYSGGFGIYLKGGIAHVGVNSLESIALGDVSSTYDNLNVYGLMTGLGFKGVHSSGLFFKLEGTYIDYQHIQLNSSTTHSGSVKRIDADPEQRSARFALGYNF